MLGAPFDSKSVSIRKRFFRSWRAIRQNGEPCDRVECPELACPERSRRAKRVEGLTPAIRHLECPACPERRAAGRRHDVRSRRASAHGQRFDGHRMPWLARTLPTAALYFTFSMDDGIVVACGSSTFSDVLTERSMSARLAISFSGSSNTTRAAPPRTRRRAGECGSRTPRSLRIATLPYGH